jgi:hypothetical protein
MASNDTIAEAIFALGRAQGELDRCADRLIKAQAELAVEQAEQAEAVEIEEDEE